MSQTATAASPNVSIKEAEAIINEAREKRNRGEFYTPGYFANKYNKHPVTVYHVLRRANLWSAERSKLSRCVSKRAPEKPTQLAANSDCDKYDAFMLDKKIKRMSLARRLVVAAGLRDVFVGRIAVEAAASRNKLVVSTLYAWVRRFELKTGMRSHNEKIYTRSVTLKGSAKMRKIHEKQDEVYAYFIAHPRASYSELSRKFGLSHYMVRQILTGKIIDSTKASHVGADTPQPSLKNTIHIPGPGGRTEPLSVTMGVGAPKKKAPGGSFSELNLNYCPNCRFDLRAVAIALKTYAEFED